MNETAASAHYRTLRERIIAGDITSETRLYESALTGDLGTSRTPIREALSLLEKDGILVRERRGYRVRERTLQEVLDYFDVRGALEAAAAEAAALRATELERAQMSAMLQRADAEPDEATRARIHDGWHQALHRASHNDALIEFIARAETLIALHRRPWVSSIAGTAESQAEHQGILDAVLARDPALARSRMAAHMSRARDYQLQGLTAAEHP
ncbi:GntR family transcriptional regulator [Herbiconiux moechotypicola]|uniref:GntR family transcriptional regulator n=1 Tax=Herbiconiux moechotypicola TaxID=637393 RepID=A0ABN3D8Y5_9MICO|nr:GntR family transcriptional regulator [Herbiconiux moechotypicola]MCS5728161.1 GntR family transcriptional regulator [Herbiconiux moechotypicola]